MMTRKNDENPTSLGPTSRSSAAEAILTMLLVAALLAGTVLLCQRAVSKVGGITGNRSMNAEAERTLQNIQRMAETAGQTRLRERPPGNADPRDITYPAVDMLVDLDDDASTGGFSAGGATGLERVLVFRSPADGRLLLARVYEYEDAQPSDVTLSSILDEGDPGAFQVKEKRAKPDDPGGNNEDGQVLEITLKMKVNGDTGTFTILLPLE